MDLWKPENTSCSRQHWTNSEFHPTGRLLSSHTLSRCFLDPRLEVLPSLHEPAQETAERSSEPCPYRVPRDEVDGGSHPNASQGHLARPRDTKKPGTDLEEPVDPKLGQPGRRLDDDAVGVDVHDLRGGGGPGRDVQQLVDGALPLVPLRRVLVLGLAHLAEVLRDLLALLLGDAAQRVARRPGDALGELDDHAGAEDQVVLAGSLGLPLVEPDAAEGRAAVQDELLVGVDQFLVAALGVCALLVPAPDDVEVIDAGWYIELEFGEVDLAADEKEELIDLSVAGGAVDFPLEMLRGCNAECRLGCGKSDSGITYGDDVRHVPPT